MKITRQSEMELVVEDSGLWLAVILALASAFLFYSGLVTGTKGTLFPAGLFVLFALFCIRKTQFVFLAGERVVRWKKLVLFKVSTGSLRFDEIRGIGFEASAGGGDGGPTYRLTILTDHAPIPIASWYTSGRGSHAAVREQILAFLAGVSWASLKAGIPGVSSQPPSLEELEPSIRELVRGGRFIDAVTLVRSMHPMSLTEATMRVRDIQDQVKAGK